MKGTIRGIIIGSEVRSRDVNYTDRSGEEKTMKSSYRTILFNELPDASGKVIEWDLLVPMRGNNPEVERYKEDLIRFLDRNDEKIKSNNHIAEVDVEIRPTPRKNNDGTVIGHRNGFAGLVVVGLPRLFEATTEEATLVEKARVGNHIVKTDDVA
jgi:hypothetical protein